MWPFSWFKQSNRQMGRATTEPARDLLADPERPDKWDSSRDPVASDPAAGAFLAAICDCPEDDAPRLDFANWLEGVGQGEWAEFIRTQVAHARALAAERAGKLPSDPYLPKSESERRLELEWSDREEAVCREVVRRWAPDLFHKLDQKDKETRTALEEFSRSNEEAFKWGAKISPDPSIYWKPEWTNRVHELLHSRLPSFDGIQWGRVERGFVSEVHASDDELLNRHISAVVKLSPIQRVRVHNRYGLAGLVSQAALKNIRAFVCEGANDTCAAVIAGAVNLSGLRELTLWNLITDRGARSLSSSPLLTNLVILNLTSNPISAEGAHMLIERYGLSGGKSMVRIDEKTGPGRDLGLKGQFLGPWGIRQLVTAASFAPPPRLRLEKQQIGDEGVEALVAQPCMSRVQWLDLDDNQIGCAGAAALANSPHLGNLKTLVLHGNSIGDEGVVALARSAGLPSLEVLACRANGIGNLGAQALAGTTTLPNLRQLILDDNPITSGSALRARFGNYRSSLG
jgi:uncharacterized protein (TIGR02996 family)